MKLELVNFEIDSGGTIMKNTYVIHFTSAPSTVMPNVLKQDVLNLKL